ncbi:hypothetical protein M3484_01880 [Pseudomonas sp. GX19020]|uniref:hypothetical protein n=1 Tax=Pseudomonas sp. GX19020 TaxID=2942277 RepID=UPI002018F25D|nr:hypothetical protein [Pseudomonas sp. GX19020]MCL4065325.1 hypothetical protein [Pseudomonas sp. GX19020]
MTRGEQFRAAEFLQAAARKRLREAKALPPHHPMRIDAGAEAAAYLVAMRLFIGCADNTDSATPQDEGE